MADYQLRGVHGQTVEALARRILSGEIPEGATLDLLSLREELDVSLTALREALKVLSAKGIIDARQKRGTFVRPRAAWNTLDGDVHALALGRPAGPRPAGAPGRGPLHRRTGRGALAAQRANDDDLAALDAALARMAEPDGDAADAVAADLGFHRALLAATHNPLLTEMERIIANGLAMRDKVVHGHEGTADDPVPSHRAVLDAIRAGNASAAEQAMRELVAKANEDFHRVAGRP